MKSFKKPISLLLALVMVLSLLPVSSLTAFADDCQHEGVTLVSAVSPTYANGVYADGSVEYWHCASCGKDFTDSALTEEISDPTLHYFEFVDEGSNGSHSIKLLKCNSNDAQITVPDTVPNDYYLPALRGLYVNTVAGGAFYNKMSLTSVTLGDHVNHIGTDDIGLSEDIGAFEGCTALEEIHTGSALDYLAEFCFYGCSALRLFESTSTQAFDDYEGLDYLELDHVLTIRCFHDSYLDYHIAISNGGEYALDFLDETVTHTWVEDSYSWDWEANGTVNPRVTCTLSCDWCCEERTLDAEVYVEEITEPATCGEEGEADLTASVTIDGQTFTDRATAGIDATNAHTYSSWDAADWETTSDGFWDDLSVPPDCVFTYTCTVCQDEIDERVTGTVSSTVPSTCTTAGSVMFLATPSAGSASTQSFNLPIDPDAHSLTRVAPVEPTSSVPGNIEYWRCSGCGKYFADANGETEITQAQTVRTVAVPYVDAAGTAQTPVTDYSLVTADTTALTAGCWVVSGNVTNNNGLTVSGNVDLILCDGATLTVTKGVAVQSGKTFTVYGQSGQTGKLTANQSTNSETGYSLLSGIGGDSNGMGNVVINGGAVEATGAFDGAGIGRSNGWTSGRITINGGTVTASSGDTNGPGIGGSNAVITINGGTVSATAHGSNTSAIGGALSNDTSSVTINGGNITATGSVGIGGANATVTLSYGDGADDRVSITASSYQGTVTLSKRFVSTGGGSRVVLQPTNAVTNLSTLAGKTLRSVKDWDWMDLQDRINNASNGDTITLAKNVTAEAEDGPLTIPAGKSITLDLAGWKINRSMQSAASNGSAIVVSGSLTLTSTASPEYTSWITGGWQTGSGGGIRVESGGTLHVSNVSIDSNKAVNGGGIYNAGTLTVGSGAEIEGNTASDSGGGIYNNGGVLNLTGGTITGNYATSKYGGGIINLGTLNVSGAPTVDNNYRGSVQSRAGNNITLYELSSNPGRIIHVTGALSENARLSVNIVIGGSYATGVITDGLSTFGTRSSFGSDDGDQAHIVDLNASGEAVLAVRRNVYFEANGGSGTMSTENAANGLPYTLPPCEFTAPAGKAFKEWSVANGSSAAIAAQPGQTITVTGNVTLTAIWRDVPNENSIYASFDPGMGSGTVWSDFTNNGSFVLPECTFTAPTGKLFMGWLSDLDDTVYQAGTTVTLSADTTFTAQWKAGYVQTATYTFEDGALPDGWTVIDGGIYWKIEDGYPNWYSAHSGTYFASTNDSNEGSYTYLIMPAQDLSDCLSASLDLWYINPKLNNYNNGTPIPKTNYFYVYFRVNGGNWVTLFSTQQDHGNWTNWSCELPAAALTSNVEIGFRVLGQSGFRVGLDDVTFTKEVLSRYDITVSGSDRFGTITADKASATEGETVTLTAAPAEGAVLRSLSVTANGQEVPVENNSFVMPASDVTVTAVFGIAPVAYVDAAGSDQTPAENASVIEADTVTLTEGWWVVDGDVTASNRLVASGAVNLILCDGTTLTASKGIQVGRDSSLTIWAQSHGAGCGKLTANGGDYQAGIGSDGTDNTASKYNNGNIVINGGEISARGGRNGAGIGGGRHSTTGNITINNGNILSIGGTYAAGIGGGGNGNWSGSYGHITSITINGGTIDARGNGVGAGIGGGGSGSYGAGNVGTITITGGSITATSSNGWAIGPGKGSTNGSVTGSITLTWTDDSYASMSVTAGSYGTPLVLAKGFTDGTDFYLPTDSADASALANKTLTPCRTYTITFENADGTELQSGFAAEGATPAYNGETPAKDADDYYTYTFSGWTPSLVAVAADATYTAGFTQTARSYDISIQPPTGDPFTLTVTSTDTIAQVKAAIEAAQGFAASTQTLSLGSTQLADSGTLVSYEIKAGDTLALDVPTYDYVDAAGTAQTPVMVYNLLDASTETLTEGWWIVASDVTNNHRLTVSGSVNLLLCDGATLTAPKGINVASPGSLTIWAQSHGTGCGALIINYVENSNPGIGNPRYSGGNLGSITINGGELTVTGGQGAPGIGAAGGTGGSVTINAGKVTATGGEYGPGIGNTIAYVVGYVPCTVTITGGEIFATGGSCAAGIGGGGGDGDVGGTINISGGKITATGGDSKPGCDSGNPNGVSGAGIGAGGFGNHNSSDNNHRAVTNINISGGEITATGGTDGAGRKADGIGNGTIRPAIVDRTSLTTSVSLSWTAATKNGMSVTANAYGGTVTVASDFYNTTDGVLISGSNTALSDVSALAGKTLVPYDPAVLNVSWYEQFSTPEGWWNGAPDGTASYSVQLYKDGAVLGSPITPNYTSYDFLELMNGAGSYRFTVTAYDQSGMPIARGESAAVSFYPVTINVSYIDNEDNPIAGADNGYVMFGVNGHGESTYGVSANRYYTAGTAFLRVAREAGWNIVSAYVNGTNVTAQATNQEYSFELSGATSVSVTFRQNLHRIAVTLEVGEGRSDEAEAIKDALNAAAGGEIVATITPHGTTVTVWALEAQDTVDFQNELTDILWDLDLYYSCVFGTQASYASYNALFTEQEEIRNDPITSHTSWTITWLTVLDALDFTVAAPVCGTYVSSTSSQTGFTQDPQPTVTCANATVQGYWVNSDGYSLYTGEIVGGQDYTVRLTGLEIPFGYSTDSNTVYRINGIACENRYMLNATVTAVHNYYNGECTGCGLAQTFPYINAAGEDMPEVASYTFVTADTSAMSNGWYVVDNDMYITNNNRITVTGTVNLLLCDSARLNVPQGITVSEGNTLVIWQQRGEHVGELTIGASGSNQVAENKAAIGGSSNQSAGTITINGGCLRVCASTDTTYGYSSAAIGGGYKGSGGTITINAGTVTAVGGPKTAAIGGGYNGAAGTITINGGEVTAAGGENGAGIGTGYLGSGGTITITGGTVHATGDYNSAAIGGGDHGAVDSITITGGDIVAEALRNGSSTGVGIGASYGSTANVSIQLGWTDDTKDSTRIYASMYNGVVTLLQPFKNESNENEIFAAGSIASGIARKTLVPYWIPVYYLGHSLSLNGDIGVNFYVDLNSVAPETAKVVFTWDTDKSETVELESLTAVGGIYKLTAHVAAKEMTDVITATLYDGETVIDSCDYSVTQYASYVLGEIDAGRSEALAATLGLTAEKLAKLGTLCKALLIYGAKAQAQFNYKTDALADASLSAEDKNLINLSSDEKSGLGTITLSNESLAPLGLQFYGASLVLESETTLRLYFKVTDQAAYAGTELRLNGTALTATPNGSFIYYDIADIAAKDVLNDYTVDFGTAEGETFTKVCGATFNNGWYIASMLGDAHNGEAIQPTVTALYRYSKAAKAYFTNN